MCFLVLSEGSGQNWAASFLKLKNVGKAFWGPVFSKRSFFLFFFKLPVCFFLIVTGPPRLIHFGGSCFYMNLFTFSHFSDWHTLTHHRIYVLFSVSFCCMCRTAGPPSTWLPPSFIPQPCVLSVFLQISFQLSRLPAVLTASLVPSALA